MMLKLMRTMTVAVVVSAALTATGSSRASEPEQEHWRAHLAYLADGSGVWVTSNAAYRQPGEPPEYAMGYRLGPAGLTVTGCLWGRDEGRSPVFWQFFSGWDPVAAKVLNYQAAPSGTVGIGHETFEGDVAVSDQVFVATDGTRSESRHSALRIDHDTYETTSFAREGGAWVKRRSYRWIRQPAGAALPCAATS